MGTSGRSLGRTRRRWKDNIQVYLKELECEVVDWILQLTQDIYQWRAVLNTVMNLPVP